MFSSNSPILSPDYHTPSFDYPNLTGASPVSGTESLSDYEEFKGDPVLFDEEGTDEEGTDERVPEGHACGDDVTMWKWAQLYRAHHGDEKEEEEGVGRPDEVRVIGPRYILCRDRERAKQYVWDVEDDVILQFPDSWVSFKTTTPDSQAQYFLSLSDHSFLLCDPEVKGKWLAWEVVGCDLVIMGSLDVGQEVQDITCLRKGLSSWMFLAQVKDAKQDAKVFSWSLDTVQTSTNLFGLALDGYHPIALTMGILNSSPDASMSSFLVIPKENKLSFYFTRSMLQEAEKYGSSVRLTNVACCHEVDALYSVDIIRVMSLSMGGYVAVGGEKGSVAVMNVANGKVLWKKHVTKGPVLQVHILNDFLILIVTTTDLQLWDFHASFRLGRLFGNSSEQASAWGYLSHLGNLNFVQCRGREVNIWRPGWKGMEVREVASDMRWLFPGKALFSPCDPDLIIFSSCLNTHLYMWDLQKGYQGAISPKGCNLTNPNFVLWPDRPLVAVAIDQRNVEVFNYKTRLLVKALHFDHDIEDQSVTVLPSGELCVSKVTCESSMKRLMTLYNPDKDWACQREECLTYMKPLSHGYLEVKRTNGKMFVLHPSRPWLAVKVKSGMSYVLNPHGPSNRPVITMPKPAGASFVNPIHLPSGIKISTCVSTPLRRVYLSLKKARGTSIVQLGTLHLGFNALVTLSHMSAKEVESGDIHILCSIGANNLFVFVVPASLLGPEAPANWSLHYMKDSPVITGAPLRPSSEASVGFRIYSQMTTASLTSCDMLQRSFSTWEKTLVPRGSEVYFWYCLLFNMMEGEFCFSSTTKLPTLQSCLNYIRDKAQSIEGLLGNPQDFEDREGVEEALLTRLYNLFLYHYRHDEHSRFYKEWQEVFGKAKFLPAILHLLDSTHQGLEERQAWLCKAASLGHGASMLDYGISLLPTDCGEGKTWIEKALKAGVTPTAAQKRKMREFDQVEASLEDFPEGAIRDMMGFLLDPCTLSVPSRMVVPISSDGEPQPPLAMTSMLAMKKAGAMRHPLTRKEISSWKTVHWLNGILDVGFAELKKYQKDGKKVSEEGDSACCRAKGKGKGRGMEENANSHRKRQRVEA